LMDLAGKIEEDRIKIDTNRLDFAKKKRDAANDNGSATEGSGGASGTQGGSVAGVAPVTALPPPFQPSVRSIFSFGSSSVAQVFVAPGQSIPVHAGDELPDGTKVLAVSENTVTVHKKNARHSSVLARATTVDGGPAVTALLSTAPQAAQAQAGVVQSAAPQAAPVPPAPKPPGQQ
jgi:type IV pilus biogenesis protein PilP